MLKARFVYCWILAEKYQALIVLCKNKIKKNITKYFLQWKLNQMDSKKLREQELTVKGGGASTFSRFHINILNKERDPWHPDSISYCLIKSKMTLASPLLMVIISIPSPITPNPTVIHPPSFSYMAALRDRTWYLHTEEDGVRLLHQQHSQEKKEKVLGEPLKGIGMEWRSHI